MLYMVTWIPSIYPLYVSIYTSTMDPIYIYMYIYIYIRIHIIYVQHVTAPRSCAAASASSAAFGLPGALVLAPRAPRGRALRGTASASRPKAPEASA